ncbi:unnamed protein product [Thelazia callipaeda]|uniref:SCP domain-containing protein n=1 Tax=Thelazia callipaeda TaxID=103827 RepID=A0A0N5CT59_THECL|nr:unnamed protein product [Thelazia callipaeda]
MLKTIYSTLLSAVSQYAKDYLNLVANDLQCQGGKLTPQQRQDIVDVHNSLRSNLINGKERNRDKKPMPKGKNMLKITWGCDLEETAQQWADRCVFEHSQQANNGIMPVEICTCTLQETSQMGYKCIYPIHRAQDSRRHLYRCGEFDRHEMTP